MKPNVHCVWLAKGGRKGVKTMRFQLIIYLIKHVTNLTSIGQCFNFSNCKLGKTQKKGCDFEAVNISCMVCIKEM